MNSKWFLKSKTIIGILIASVPTLAAALGWAIDAEVLKSLNEGIAAAFVLVGSIMAILGRVKAKSILTIKP